MEGIHEMLIRIFVGAHHSGRGETRYLDFKFFHTESFHMKSTNRKIWNRSTNITVFQFSSDGEYHI